MSLGSGKHKTFNLGKELLPSSLTMPIFRGNVTETHKLWTECKSAVLKKLAKSIKVI
jgi:hypothetical protein